MTQEGRVEDFWTTRRRDQADDDNVRPLLKALAAARRSLDEEHYAAAGSDDGDAIVLDIRPQPLVADEVESAPPPIEPAVELETAQPPAAAEPARQAVPDWIMVDPPEEDTPAQDAPEWGDLWRESVQGWVRTGDGTKIWRPIVTTTTAVPNWDIDTNLGMVTGESACAIDADRLGVLLASPAGAASLRRELAEDRRVAEEAMVQEAVARGAHAVIGVKLDYTPLGDCLIVTATGTAVTLRTAR